MTTQTLSGDLVTLVAPTALVDFYKSLSLSAIMADPAIVDQAFAWIHAFHDSNLSGGQHVQPMLKATITDVPQGGQISYKSLLILIILARHNQEPWLHDRMTFHGLADIQDARKNIRILRDLCEAVDALQAGRPS